MNSSRSEAATYLKKLALEQGFDLAGIATATKSDGFPHLIKWLEKGYQGKMDYIPKRISAYENPASLLTNVQSILIVGYNYNHKTLPNNALAKVASYAHGQDYHEILWDKLTILLNTFQQRYPECIGRGVVDTTPLLERDFAKRAGLGWIGKNTMLINKKAGSFMVLGALLTTMELEPDAPIITDHCGTCTACIKACPTQAIVSPKILDATKCISYLTIELKSEIPVDLRPGMGDWIFGCDICQDVCPWNTKAPLAKDWNLYRNPELEAIDPVELLELSPADFKKKFRHTPFWRPKRKGILRNACIVLGNIGTKDHLQVLEKARLEDEPLISEAAAWAIQNIQLRLAIKPNPVES